MLDHDFTLQAVMELQKSVGELAAKTDRLISDVSSQHTLLQDIRMSLAFVKGAAWVIGGLLTLAWAAALVLGSKLVGK